MAIKMKKATGEATMTKTIVDNKAKTNISEDVSQEKVEVPGPDKTEALAEVTVEAAFTKNLGNYQSARLVVGLKLPAGLDELDAKFGFATSWVNTKLEGLLADMES